VNRFVNLATSTRRRRPTIRSVAIGDLHEIFLVSSIGMILVIRLQLWATNYPKLGSGRLHFAHLLWGGLLMLVAIGILLSFVDRRLRVPTAVVAGAGFGFFIDEVGKFVTSNNDYFFKPTGAIIYLTFIVVYFALPLTCMRTSGTTPCGCWTRPGSIRSCPSCER
jgi:hypothetical protein